MEFDFLPALSSALNFASTCLLVAGWLRIRRGDRDGHRRAMVAALFTSSAFLVSYLVHHLMHGIHGSGAQGGARLAYQIVLKSHTALSVCSAVLVPRVAWLAFKGRFERHRVLARIALPIWLYVSATGVVLYVMAYHLWPSSSAS